MAKITHPTPEQVLEKEKQAKLAESKIALPTISFDSMTRAQKDEMLKYLLRKEGLIE
jgi:hypothetical protein